MPLLQNTLAAASVVKSLLRSEGLCCRAAASSSTKGHRGVLHCCRMRIARVSRGSTPAARLLLPALFGLAGFLIGSFNASPTAQVKVRPLGKRPH